MGDEPIADFIEQTRVNLGLRLTDVANRAGIPVQTLSRIVNQKHRSPQWHTIMTILREGLGVQIELTLKPATSKQPERAEGTLFD